MDVVKEGVKKPDSDSDALKFIRVLWHSLLVRVADCSSSNNHLLERLFTLAGEICGTATNFDNPVMSNKKNRFGFKLCSNVVSPNFFYIDCTFTHVDMRSYSRWNRCENRCYPVILNFMLMNSK